MFDLSSLPDLVTAAKLLIPEIQKLEPMVDKVRPLIERFVSSGEKIVDSVTTSTNKIVKEISDKTSEVSAKFDNHTKAVGGSAVIEAAATITAGMVDAHTTPEEAAAKFSSIYDGIKKAIKPAAPAAPAKK